MPGIVEQEASLALQGTPTCGHPFSRLYFLKIQTCKVTLMTRFTNDETETMRFNRSPSCNMDH